MEVDPIELLGRLGDDLRRAQELTGIAPLAPPASSSAGLGSSSGTVRISARPPKSEPEVAVLAHERDDLRKLLEINKRLNQQHDLRTLLQTIRPSSERASARSNTAAA